VGLVKDDAAVKGFLELQGNVPALIRVATAAILILVVLATAATTAQVFGSDTPRNDLFDPIRAHQQVVRQKEDALVLSAEALVAAASISQKIRPVVNTIVVVGTVQANIVEIPLGVLDEFPGYGQPDVPLSAPAKAVPNNGADLPALSDPGPVAQKESSAKGAVSGMSISMSIPNRSRLVMDSSMPLNGQQDSLELERRQRWRRRCIWFVG
jgi:hypothetical protein